MTLISYITPACPVCGHASTLRVDADALAAWQSGTLIQKAFPDMPVEHRELLISGIHPWCWDLLDDGSE